jgi:hypothetical protein
MEQQMSPFWLRLSITILLGSGSGWLTLNFTRKKDPTGLYLKEVGYPIFLFKVTLGILIGILGLIPVFPILRAFLLSFIVGSLSLRVVYKKLDRPKDCGFILVEFLVLGIVSESIVTYLLHIPY